MRGLEVSEMMNRHVLLLSVPLLLALACGKSDKGTAPQDAAVILPLDVGNRWGYLSTVYDSSGNIDFQGAWSARIRGDTLIAGARWYRYESQIYENYLMQQRIDGLWEWDVFYYPDALPFLRAKYPASHGQTFVGGENTLLFGKVTGVEVNVNVAAGSFSCVEYSFSLNDTSRLLGRLWYAPGTGLVKTEVMDSTLRIEKSVELQWYKPASMKDNVIMPIALGNSWTYSVSIYDSLGRLRSSSQQVVKVWRDTVLGSQNWFLVGSAGAEGIYMANREGGLWSTYTYGRDCIIAPYPAAKGDTLRSCEGRMRVMSTTTSVQVPRGTYSCYEYEISDIESGVTMLRQFYAPGVGKIKEEAYTPYTRETRVIQLLSAEIW